MSLLTEILRIKSLINEDLDKENEFYDYQGLDNQIKKTGVLYPKEKDLFTALKKFGEDNGLKVESKNRSVLNGSEIDIYFPDIKVGFEFQGDDHYKYVSKIITDNKKKEIAEKKGVKIINYPYYFGWDNEYMSELVGGGVNFDLPNSQFGFLDTFAFPSSFSEEGVNRFIREVDSLPKRLQKEIIDGFFDRQHLRFSDDINDDFPEWNDGEEYFKDMVVTKDGNYFIARRKTKSNPSDEESDWGPYFYPERKSLGIYDIISPSMEDWYLNKIKDLYGFG